MPAASEMDPPLAKNEPISSGDTFWIIVKGNLSGNVILGNIFPGLIRLKSIILKQADNVNEGMKTHAVGRRKTEVIFKLYSCV
ncbi:hypothetical protein TURU_093096 [Turdus rufiventris]|nr:hypothetical protein TURU_093096 [Turdus rufiventris]